MKRKVMPVAFLIIDQIIKALVRWQLLPGESLLSFGSFGITHFENTSGPFSLPIPAPFLIVSHIVIVLAACIAYRRAREYRSGLAWIIAGGVSNLIDRLIFHSTTDYIALPFHGYWNLADVAVVIGIVLLLRIKPASPQVQT